MNASQLTDEHLMAIAGAYNAGSSYTLNELWEYGYAGGYGREAIQNRVRDNQIYSLLDAGCGSRDN